MVSASSSRSARPAAASVLAEGLELGVGRRAQADAENDPAVREVVERGHLPGHDGRPTAGERRDHRPEPEPRRPHGHHAQGDPRIDGGEHRIAPVQHVVPEEEAVPPRRLRGRGEVTEQFDVGVVAQVGNGQSEAHHANSAANRRRHSTLPLSACTLTTPSAQRQHARHPLEHALVLLADRAVEGDHLLGRDREVVVAPDDEREVAVDVVDGGRAAAGGCGRARSRSGSCCAPRTGGEAGAHAAVQHLRRLARDRLRCRRVVDVDLVLVAVQAVVEVGRSRTSARAGRGSCRTCRCGRTGSGSSP